MDPPFEPMLARLERTLPVGSGVTYEPKWDGFRALAVRRGEEVELWSRHGRPLARYFPEVVEAVLDLRDPDLILDGEVLVANRDAAFDFATLLSRLHPAASRVERLRRETPASFIAFDIARSGGEDLRERPFADRRRQLEQMLTPSRPPLSLTPITRDADVGRAWLEGRAGGGVDGVVAKDGATPYRPGERLMVKVKRQHTVDCVVAGYRWLEDRPAIGSLLLGLFGRDGRLWHVGVVSSFSEAARRRFLDELSPSAIRLAEHPWADGFLIERSPLGRLKGAAGRWTPDMAHDWVPIRIERVAEVAYDRFDGDRFRHPARFVRWRPDRVARSCSFDQLDAETRTAGALLAGGG